MLSVLAEVTELQPQLVCARWEWGHATRSRRPVRGELVDRDAVPRLHFLASVNSALLPECVCSFCHDGSNDVSRSGSYRISILFRRCLLDRVQAAAPSTGI